MKKFHSIISFIILLPLIGHTQEEMIWGTIPLKDSVLIESISMNSFDPNSNYALSYNSMNKMILIQNGVQIIEIDATIQNILESKYNRVDFSSKTNHYSKETSPKSKSLFEQIQQRSIPWKSLGNWPSELILKGHIQLQNSEINEERNHNSLVWTTQANPNIWLGIGLEHLKNIGSYSKTLYLKDSTAFNSWLLSFSIAMPFVKYQIQKSNTNSSPFLFLEPNLKTSLVEHNSSLIKLVNDSLPNDYSDNYLHTLEFKLGYLHVKYWMDEDTYQDKITQYFLQDLPLGSSTWWMGITEGTNTWAPGIGFQFSQINLGSYQFKNQFWQPHIAINSGFWWRGPGNLSFDFGIEFHIPQFFPEFK